MIDILAQTPAAAYIIPSVGFAAIIGAYIIMGRQSQAVNKQISTHVTDTKIHPEKKDIVFEKTCQKQHSLDSKLGDERHKELRESLKELKDLILSK